MAPIEQMAGWTQTMECKLSGVINYRKLFLNHKGWLAIAKLKSLSLFISLLLMLKKAFDNVKIEK